MRSLVQSSAGVFQPPLQVLRDTAQDGTDTVTFPYAVPQLPLGNTLPASRPIPRPSSGACGPVPNPTSFFNVQNDSLLLSTHTKDHVTRAIQGGWAESTLKRYTGTIKQFIRFCDTEHVPEHLRFPADEFVLCAFAASSFGRHAGGTPRSRMTALKAWHAAHNVEWKGSIRLRYILNGVHNFAPSSSRQPLRPPINAAMLVQLIQNLDLNIPLDAAIAACAVIAFWGQCRLGELLPLSSSAFSPALLPSRSDFKRSLRNPEACNLHLPRTKTHRHGQDVVIVDQRFPINPISLLKNHFRVNNVQSKQFLFAFHSPNGPSFLSKKTFLRRCNSIWSTLGYPRTTGHCFRIGGTTELLVAGVSPDIVRVTGRWSSESFFRYWRSLDEIAPRHIRNVYFRKHRFRR
jgi:hypothetical protein